MFKTFVESAAAVYLLQLDVLLHDLLGIGLGHVALPFYHVFPVYRGKKDMFLDLLGPFEARTQSLVRVPIEQLHTHKSKDISS